MKSSSWMKVVALTLAAVTLPGQMGCGSEESKSKGGLLDGGSGAGGGGGAGGATIVPGHSAVLGKACASDADCAAEPGLTCITSTSGALDSGSPAHGICTAPCGVPGTFTCVQIDGAAACVAFSASTAYCMPGCSFGSPAIGQTKCQGRADLACTSVFDFEFVTPAATGGTCQVDSDCRQGFACSGGGCVLVTPACMPQCNSNADCGTGQSCDFGSTLLVFGTGLCRGNPPAALPTGAACDPQAQVNPCRGACLQLSTSAGVCVDGCTVGANISCGWSGTGPASAGCYPAFPGDGAGDAGFCRPLCSCTADCGTTGLVCTPFPVGASDATKYGRPGYCVEPPAGGAGGMPTTLSSCAGGAGGAPSAGAGGVAGAGG